MIDKVLLHQHRDKIADTLFKCIKDMWLTPDDRLFVFMREQNLQLKYWLDDENRLLAAAAGEPVEPKAHQISAVLQASFGGGM